MSEGKYVMKLSKTALYVQFETEDSQGEISWDWELGGTPLEELKKLFKRGAGMVEVKEDYE